jgi:hypothetical protein
VALNNHRIVCVDAYATLDDVVLAIAVAAVYQFVTALYLLLFDTPTLHVKIVTRKRKREETSYKRNIFVRYGCPTMVLEPKQSLGEVLLDDNHA